MMIKQQISEKLDDFKDLCGKHKIKYLYAFGSSVTDQFKPQKSDIDLLVQLYETDPMERGEYLISLWDTFESFFHTKVDLLTESSLKNPFLRKSIDSTKVLIYDGERKKVFI